MNIPSLIFWAVFVVPLVILLTWIMRQDKRKGATGLVVLARNCYRRYCLYVCEDKRAVSRNKLYTCFTLGALTVKSYFVFLH